MQKNSDIEDLEKGIDFVGGHTRFFIHFVLYLLRIKSSRPVRKRFVVGPSKGSDYYGYTNTKFRNLIATIIVGFIVFVIIAKTLRTVL